MSISTGLLAPFRTIEGDIDKWKATSFGSGLFSLGAFAQDSHPITDEKGEFSPIKFAYMVAGVISTVLVFTDNEARSAEKFLKREGLRIERIERSVHVKRLHSRRRKKRATKSASRK